MAKLENIICPSGHTAGTSNSSNKRSLNERPWKVIKQKIYNFANFFSRLWQQKIFTIVPLSSLCADVDWANFFSMLDGAMTSPRSASLWKAHGHDWQNGAIDWVQGLENCANRASRFRGNTLAHARCCSLAASVTRLLGYLQQRKFTLKQKKCTKVRSTFCQITPKISPKMLIIFCQSGEICQIWSHLSLSISVLDSLFHSWLLSLSQNDQIGLFWTVWATNFLTKVAQKFSNILVTTIKTSLCKLKTSLDSSGQLLEKQLGHFLFQHLVTLRLSYLPISQLFLLFSLTDV